MVFYKREVKPPLVYWKMKMWCSRNILGWVRTITIHWKNAFSYSSVPWIKFCHINNCFVHFLFVLWVLTICHWLIYFCFMVYMTPLELPILCHCLQSFIHKIKYLKHMLIPVLLIYKYFLSWAVTWICWNLEMGSNIFACTLHIAMLQLD